MPTKTETEPPLALETTVSYLTPFPAHFPFPRTVPTPKHQTPTASIADVLVSIPILSRPCRRVGL